MDALKVRSQTDVSLANEAELARQVQELRRRRHALLEGHGASEDVLELVEALDRRIDETFLGFISNQAAALRDSAERLRLAVEASDLGFWEFDPATDERHWSRRCKELFGFPLDDGVVSQERFISTLHPDDRPRWYAVERDALDPHGERRFRIEYRIVRPSDGVERWISATGRTQFDGDDRPLRMIGTLRDVTEQAR
jgi:PAS domain S-box-containing protein